MGAVTRILFSLRCSGGELGNQPQLVQTLPRREGGGCHAEGPHAGVAIDRQALADEANCYGTCSTVQKLILIDVSVSDYTTASTLIHELLHAIHSEYNVKGIDEEERIVRCVGRGLMQVFFDNPRLVDYIAETMIAARLALKSQEP